jgi:subtilisin family serine protease
MNRFGKLVLSVILLVSYTVSAQENVDKKILNWYNGAKFGMSTDKAYAKLLADKKSQTVVVAVIDSGVDIEHEDLKGQIWLNEDEIPGNGIDDDKNGYIDDVHGWNFLGNPDGENLNAEQLEVTRIYVALHKKYEGKSETTISPDDKSEFAKYQEVKTVVEGERAQAEKYLEIYSGLLKNYKEADKNLKEHFGGEYTLKQAKKLLKDEKLGKDAAFIYGLNTKGANEARLQGTLDHFESQLKHHYGLDFEPRKIVGDNPTDFSDVNYGNNDVEGPDAFHGTHVSGIIAAVRNNGIGNDGVATNVKIMSVRTIPDGDERDKDVALAIRYAVDNGAQIINGSFGKAYSPNQGEVMEAIRYAESKGVLIVHAAGNDGKDIGVEPNYPSPKYSTMSEKFTNWIEVGASTRYKKAKKGHDGLAASFSNYNKEMVDVYAPGLEIYATTPNNEYAAIQGTSMAAPMVAGVAALLKSYFPNLTMFEIRDIIFASVQDVSGRTTPLPGDTKEVEFGTLSATGGIVNVYNAVLMAEEKSASK